MEIQLIGAGGLAKDIVACFRAEVFISGIWDDALKRGEEFYGIPVLGKVKDIPKNYLTPVVIAVGHPPVRKKLYDFLLNVDAHLATLIHSSVIQYDASTIRMGPGCILMPQVYLTSSIELEPNCLLHIQSALHHDVKLGSHSVLMPGAKITCVYSAPELFLLDTNQSVTYLTKTNEIT